MSKLAGDLYWTTLMMMEKADCRNVKPIWHAQARRPLWAGAGVSLVLLESCSLDQMAARISAQWLALGFELMKALAYEACSKGHALTMCSEAAFQSWET